MKIYTIVDNLYLIKCDLLIDHHQISNFDSIYRVSFYGAEDPDYDRQEQEPPSRGQFQDQYQENDRYKESDRYQENDRYQERDRYQDQDRYRDQDQYQDEKRYQDRNQFGDSFQPINQF